MRYWSQKEKEELDDLNMELELADEDELVPYVHFPDQDSANSSHMGSSG